MKLFKSFKNRLKITHVSDPEERYVALQLMKSFSNGDYAVISNVLIPYSGKIGTSQIDHIVVSVHGIFCIETKSHKGWIYGSKVTRLFTQVLFRHRYRIAPNPVTQNQTHVRALRELLGNKVKAPIVNVVVFPSAEKFVMDGYENVGSMNDLYNVISSRHEKIYLYKEAEAIIDIIRKANMKNAEAHAYHIRSVKAKYATHSAV